MSAGHDQQAPPEDAAPEHPELPAEREYVAGLYARLDALRE